MERNILNNNEEIKMEKDINIKIKEAMGNRTIEQFAKDCNLSTTLLKQIQINPKLITPDILKKIANNAQNKVSYGRLMVAAGFLNLKDTYDHYVPLTDDLQGEQIAFSEGLDGFDQELIDQVCDYFAMIKERNNHKNEEE